MTPAEARQEAHRILSERRFHGTPVPRPLHGFLHWLGEKFSFLGRFSHWLDRQIGIPHLLWWIVAAAVIAFVTWIAVRLARRRTRADRAAALLAPAERSQDPRELERLADEAERRGDLEVALRLRFRAGLVRLARAERLPARTSLRTGEARRILRNPRFDRLARDHDEIVYGRRPARAADVRIAREEWPLV